MKPLQHLRFHALTKRRYAIFNLLNVYKDRVITKQIVETLAEQIADEFKYKAPPEHSLGAMALESSSVPNKQPLTLKQFTTNALNCTLENELIGAVLNIDKIRALALKLAANNTALQTNGALPATRSPQKEWVVVEILEARWKSTPKRKLPGARLTFLIWTGYGAGMQFTQFFTLYAYIRLAKDIKLINKYKYTPLHHRELVKIKFIAQLDSGADLRILQYTDRALLTQRNKARYKERKQKTNCKYKTDLPCHFCPKGWRTCINGTHEQDYVKRSCKRGHYGWFDPQTNISVCINCEAKRWLRIHTEEV